MNISTAINEDAEHIVELIDSVYNYGLEKKNEKWNHWVKTVESNIAFYRVLHDNKMIIGICYTGWRNLHFEQKPIKICDLSEICIKKAFQKKGFGKILLQDSIELMRRNNIDITRLHIREKGLIDFYKDHYKPFPYKYVEIKNQEKNQKENPGVEIYNPESDFEICKALYNNFNQKYIGSLIWEGNQGNWKNSNRLVYKEDNKIIGSMYADVNFGYIAMKQYKEYVLVKMIEWLLAKNKDKGKILLRLPEDDIIKNCLRDNNIDYKYIELTKDETHNMIGILDESRLMKQYNNNVKLSGSVEDRFYNYMNSVNCSYGSEIWGYDNLNITKYPLHG